jgi:hypothetical protein
MRVLRGIRPSPATVIASIALLVALAGTGYAATSLPANSVGPRQLQNNAVTTSKVKDRSLRAVDFAPGQIPRGPRGFTGAPGPPGAAGAPGARGPTGAAGTSASIPFAVVNADGSLARGSGVISVGHTAASGSYTVKFNKNISQCTWPASLRTNFGFIETEISGTTTDTVLVRTRDGGGATADRSFHLIVVC